MMDGGTDVDNNAVLFAKGAHAVLDPLGSGKPTIVGGGRRQGLARRRTPRRVHQALTAAGGQVDGVLAANDDIANAVIGVLKNNGLDGKVAVTGQDSGTEGLQNIVTGQQSMTVFKNVKLEANAAAQLAIALIAGKDPAAAGMKLHGLRRPGVAEPQDPGAAPARPGDHPGQRRRRRQGRCADHGRDLQGHRVPVRRPRSAVELGKTLDAWRPGEMSGRHGVDLTDAPTGKG